jgi:hypothetical protein
MTQQISLTFKLDLQNSNIAVGSDNKTFVAMEYDIKLQHSYVKYVSPEESLSITIDNYHNGSCALYLSRDQHVTQYMMNNLHNALVQFGMTDSISWNIF